MVAWIGLWIGLSLTSCRALPEYRTGRGGDAGRYAGDSSYGGGTSSAAAPALTLAEITQVPEGRGIYRELQRLQKLRDEPSARLRVAFLLGEVARADEAMTELNSLLFGDTDHGPTVESFAHFLRAEAFAKKGDPVRAIADRRRALSQVIDPALKARLTTLVADADSRSRAASAGSRNLTIRPRTSWKARRATPMDPMGRVYRVTIHHSAILTRNRSQRSAAASIQSIQRSHQGKNGWSDIGYHYLIDAGGRIWEGRESRWQGAHAGNPTKNRGNIGVCMLGNFIDGGQRPTADQERALASLVGWLQRRHGFNNSAIFTHSEFKVTECPGKHLQAVVDRLRGARNVAASK